MGLNYFISQLQSMLYIAPVILLAITCHEYAHGWVSDRLGDPTPRRNGRLSLNPLHHLDPVGTLCLLFFHMGWAKPVGINTAYYENRKKGVILVSLAGPLTNFCLAFISLFVEGLIIKYGNYSWTGIQILISLLYYSAVLNIGFGLFNLVPIPPLDGSHIIEELVPAVANVFEKLAPVRTIVLFVLLFTGILSKPLSLANAQILGVMIEVVETVLRL